MGPLALLLLLRPDPVDLAFSPRGRAVLDAPDRVVLYEFKNAVRRIDPGQIKRSRTMRNATERRAAVSSVYASLRGKTMSAKCINPHHALVAEKDGQKVTLMLCYSCGWMTVDEMGKGRPNVPFGRAGMASFLKLL